MGSDGDPDPGSGRIRTFLPDPESSLPDPDPDPALVMHIYKVIVSKTMFLTTKPKLS